MSYNHKEIEKKWQKYWAKTNTFNTLDRMDRETYPVRKILAFQDHHGC